MDAKYKAQVDAIIAYLQTKPKDKNAQTAYDYAIAGMSQYVSITSEAAILAQGPSASPPALPATPSEHAAMTADAEDKNAREYREAAAFKASIAADNSKHVAASERSLDGTTHKTATPADLATPAARLGMGVNADAGSTHTVGAGNSDVGSRANVGSGSPHASNSARSGAESAAKDAGAKADVTKK